ncbi:MAG TPA: hypothetical protein VHP81_10520, partial [Lachnospiraceae bacterium]|nr:hypothetical protein [Lachnospiraceae bacterium]
SCEERTNQGDNGDYKFSTKVGFLTQILPPIETTYNNFELLQILSIVKRMNIGTLAALHDLELAAEYCDYLYVIKKGKVAASGTPSELLTKKLISDVYDVDCEIYTNPITGGLSIAYLPCV